MTKRIFDIAFFLLLSIIIFPLSLCIILLIWMETSQNPIYIQTRGLTLNRQFTIYKFRTLKRNTRDCSKTIFYKKELSSQVTKTGKLLRITGLDELPQILNVIKGEMSLIGPRPLSINDLHLLKEQHPEIYRRRVLLKSKPGISGMWQVYGDRTKGACNLISLDELYENRKNIFTDLLLLIKTIPMILTANHSDSIVSSSKGIISSTQSTVLISDKN